jgi:hypothetical protein
MRENGAGSHFESRTFAFAQQAQLLALVWLEPDPVLRFPVVWDVLRQTPRAEVRNERIVSALIVSRIARAFFRAEHASEVTLTARSRRDSVGYLHPLRALNGIRREFSTRASDSRLCLGDMSVVRGTSVTPRQPAYALRLSIALAVGPNAARGVSPRH